MFLKDFDNAFSRGDVFFHLELQNGFKNFCNLRQSSKGSTLIANKFVRTYEAKQSRTASTMMAEKNEKIENEDIFKKTTTSFK